MVMKAKKKNTWVVKFYNVETGNISYRTYYETLDDINWLVDTFLEGNSSYIVSIFKLYKRI